MSSLSDVLRAGAAKIVAPETVAAGLRPIVVARNEGFLAGKAEGLDLGKAEGVQLGRADGIREGMLAERTRIRTILGSDEAKNKSALATRLALDSDLAADVVLSILSASPPEEKQVNYLAQLMANIPNPQVGADVGSFRGSGEEAEAAAMAASIVATYRSSNV